MEYIRDQFESKNRNEHRRVKMLQVDKLSFRPGLLSHDVCYGHSQHQRGKNAVGVARDDPVLQVWSAVKDILIRKSLNEAGSKYDASIISLQLSRCWFRIVCVQVDYLAVR